jgi:protein gp37
MNRQKKANGSKGIEWTDYTWNPVGGCQHACRWTMPDGSIALCYAELVAERVSQSAYSHGFAHHYWRPEKLDAPLKLKAPARIFLDSMSDLMGHWVPEEQIEQVFDVCRRAPQHTFQLLTKNAPRLAQFDIPQNVWVGVSAPPTFMFGKKLSVRQQERMVTRALEVLSSVPVSVRWMSIEPLSFDIAPLLADFHLDWAVIGAATNGRLTYQPEPGWVQHLLDLFDVKRTAVFFKGNLKWPDWYEQFPASKQTATIS